MHPHDILEPGLAISGKPLDATEVNELAFRGILNLSDFEPPRYARGLRDDIALVRRPINDIYPAPRPYLLLAVLELAHLRQRGINTLVHCHAGRSRSPTIIALYWMARDGLSWEEAISRIQALRPGVEPNRFFATEPGRPLIVETARRFLGGEHALLDAARSQREALIRALRERAPDPADREDEWNLIEAGLAVGAVTASRSSWAKHGFENATIVVEAENGDDGPPSLASLIRVLNDVNERLNSGRGACLLSHGNELAGLYALCAFLMLEREWDIATAIWFVGSRRATLWSHVDALWATDWDDLRATYRSIVPRAGH